MWVLEYMGAEICGIDTLSLIELENIRLFKVILDNVDRRN
jgi:hypothetical protein